MPGSCLPWHRCPHCPLRAESLVRGRTGGAKKQDTRLYKESRDGHSKHQPVCRAPRWYHPTLAALRAGLMVTLVLSVLAVPSKSGSQPPPGGCAHLAQVPPEAHAWVPPAFPGVSSACPCPCATSGCAGCGVRGWLVPLSARSRLVLPPCPPAWGAGASATHPCCAHQ